MRIITRKEAIELGLTRYFIGDECPRGHIDEHFVHGGCVTCNRETQMRRYNTEPEFRKKRQDYNREYQRALRAEARRKPR